MKKPIISIIAAISENGVIGNENKLLWHIPEDMKRFKEKTFGHPVIMGRKTYASIGHPLSNRTNIIVTRNKTYRVYGGKVVHSIEAAIEEAKKYEQDEIFVIGGGQIYTQVLPYADKLYITIVHKQYSGSTVFPDYSKFKKEVFRKTQTSNDLTYTFLDLVRN